VSVRRTVPDRFESIVDSVLASGEARHHDVRPSDFGEVGGRIAMLRRCLDLVMARYPRIEIAIGGTLDGLREFGLVAGVPLHVAKGAVSVGMLPLEGSLNVRLSFSLARSLKPAGACPGGGFAPQGSPNSLSTVRRSETSGSVR